ncbi:MAG: prepilin-type N-terminal cleavage/methylation domain-containing protein [Deltaproteobacteria bacterium]|nr:prepilin-type N-terminal cleavage/methylation domain-containing protein [Deltaproteobacteria bacterium]
MMRKGGFTLFEILMTLAIMSVVFSLLYMTFNQSMMVMANASDRAEVIQQGRLILERMTAELKGSFISNKGGRPQAFQYGLIGQTSRAGDYFQDRLDFTSLAHPYASIQEGRGEILEIGYFLDHEPGGKGLTLFRRQDEAVDGDLLRGGRKLAVCDGVRGLSFLFFDRQGRKQKEWNSSEGDKRHELPARIEIILTLEDSHNQIHTFRSQVFLPLAGERG